jgi:ABC-type molybdate transport system substrate-binding protein
MGAISRTHGKETPDMKKIAAFILVAIAAAGLPAGAAAQDLGVFADQRFQAPLLELVPAFTDQTGFEVELALGHSLILAERLRSGEVAADLFFPAGEEAMGRIMEKGLVDVSLKRNIVVLPPADPAPDTGAADTRYAPAAVMNNAPHRLPAMAFLEFLTSEKAREVFARQGFALP